MHEIGPPPGKEPGQRAAVGSAAQQMLGARPQGDARLLGQVVENRHGQVRDREVDRAEEIGRGARAGHDHTRLEAPPIEAAQQARQAQRRATRGPPMVNVQDAEWAGPAHGRGPISGGGGRIQRRRRDISVEAASAG
jgi:hypothetical protein